MRTTWEFGNTGKLKLLRNKRKMRNTQDIGNNKNMGTMGIVCDIGNMGKIYKGKDEYEDYGGN